MERVWVFGEHHEGKLHPVVLELLGDARGVASAVSGEVGVVVLTGADAGPDLSPLAEYGAQVIFVARHDGLKEYSCDSYTQILAQAIRQYDPCLVLLGATAQGRDLAPRVAARLGASFAPGYTTIRPEENRLVATRVVYGGKVQAAIVALSRPLIATLNPGAAGVEKPRSPGAGTVAELPPAIEPAQRRVQVLKRIPADPDTVDVSEADMVVAGGGGVGSEAGFALVQELARAIGASVGGTRVARDLGRIPFERQIGQTGKTIAPRVYIAVGISGAIHHIAGIQDSKAVLAINTDRSAPIFALADLGVVGDAHEVLPAIIRRIKGLNEQGLGKKTA